MRQRPEDRGVEDVAADHRQGRGGVGGRRLLDQPVDVDGGAVVDRTAGVDDAVFVYVLRHDVLHGDHVAAAAVVVVGLDHLLEHGRVGQDQVVDRKSTV